MTMIDYMDTAAHSFDDGISDMESIAPPPPPLEELKLMDEQRRRRGRNRCVALATVIILAALVVGLVVVKKGDNKASTGVNASAGSQAGSDSPSPTEVEDDPTGAPSSAPTSTPTLTPPGEDDRTGTPSSASTSTPTLAPPEVEDDLTEAPSSAPTSTPTLEPSTITLDPTATPSVSVMLTDAPISTETECGTALSLDRQCYDQQGDAIVIDASECGPPLDGDWIGIYMDGVDPVALGRDYVAWVYACGSDTCETTSGTTVTLQLDGGFNEGKYLAFLVRDESESPYRSAASSEAFEISTACLEPV